MHDHTETPTAEQILAKMTAEMGKTPEVMELLSKIKPSMVQEQARSMYFANALRKGVTPLEIVDALVVARVAVASTVFSNSLDGLRILVDSLAEAAPQDV